MAFRDYVKIESIRRADCVDMSTYILEFDRAHARLGKHSMTVRDSVLACKSLYSSNIDAKERMMALATTQQLGYKIMKSSLKLIINDMVSAPSRSTGPLKEKPVFVASDESAKPEETAFWVDKRRNKMWQCQRGRGRGNFKNAGKNPVDAKGNATTCVICGFRNHCAKQCPDNPENSGQEPSKKERKKSQNNEVYLTYASLPGELTKKCLRKAILDTGCTTSFAGEEWFLDYLSKLTALERKSMTKNASRVKIFVRGRNKS